MITPRFNLKDKKANNTLIFLVLEEKHGRVRQTTELSVPPKYWNDKTQSVRENREFEGGERINSKLKSIKKAVNDAVDFFAAIGVEPTVYQVKDKFIDFKNNPKKQSNTSQFWTDFDEYVKNQKSLVDLATITGYDKALRNHIKKTVEKYSIDINYNSLKNNGGFVKQFEEYLLTEAINSKGQKGLALNTVGKQMKNLKAVLNWCFEYEKVPTFSITHIVKHQEEVDNVYLTYDEIDALIDLQIDDEELEKARDLFIIGCETALRYSDLTRIKPEHIIGDDIHIVPTKKNNSKFSRNKKLIIPISSRVRLILNKLNNKPANYSIKERRDFNDNVRKACELAKIDEPCLIQERINNKNTEVFYKKYELISSHTCRRSYCTNRFKDGVPIRVIMAISGHVKEKSFLTYLKLDNNEIIQHYREMLIK